MDPVRLVLRIVVACACCIVSCAAHAADDALPPPKYQRQLAFSMPFTVAPPETPDQQLVEVSLYVSVNLGRNWELAQRVAPETKLFTYRAPADGEYWFTMRTLDRQGRILPDAIDHPDMRVVVDTVPPRLELTAMRGEAGEMKANWSAVDPQLNADSLKIDYQTTSGAWRPVAVDRPRAGGDRTTSKGVLTWWPTDAPATSVQVRAEISDLAGNSTVTQAKTQAARTSQGHEDLTTSNSSPPTGSAVSSATPPFESTTTPAGSAGVGQHAKSNGGKKGAKNSLASANRNSSNANDDSNPSGNVFGMPPMGSTSTDPARTGASAFAAGSRNDGGTQWPADHSADAPLGRNPIPSSSTANVAAINQRNDSFRLPVSEDNSATIVNPMSRGFENVSPPIRNQVLPGDQQSRASDRGFGAASLSTSAPNYSTLPPGERPRMVNSKSFDMDYEVDAVGPSGIAKVELWGTRDGGRSWTSFGVDPDNRSPMHVVVDSEGLYGFRLAVQSGSGLGGLSPRSGDVPELWVGVDLTKPSVRLNGAEAGEGPHAGELLIRWEASDSMLAARPSRCTSVTSRVGRGRLLRQAWKTPVATPGDLTIAYRRKSTYELKLVMKRATRPYLMRPILCRWNASSPKAAFVVFAP